MMGWRKRQFAPRPRLPSFCLDMCDQDAKVISTFEGREGDEPGDVAVNNAPVDVRLHRAVARPNVLTTAEAAVRGDQYNQNDSKHGWDFRTSRGWLCRGTPPRM